MCSGNWHILGMIGGAFVDPAIKHSGPIVVPLVPASVGLHLLLAVNAAKWCFGPVVVLSVRNKMMGLLSHDSVL